MRRAVLLTVILSVVPIRGVSADPDAGYVDANRWWMPLSNFGPFAFAPLPSWKCTWRNRSHCYFFGCGPWVGAVAEGDTLVSMGYNANNPTILEMGPGDSLGGAEDSLVLVYVHPRRWPPPADRFPMAPQTRRADQDAWVSFNDFQYPSCHVPPGRPIGVQLYQSVYAWADEQAQDIMFFRYVVENQTEDSLRLYAGVVCDPDIGEFDDDMYGGFYRRWFRRGPNDSLYVDHLAYAYDADNSEPGWDTVGVVGLVFIRTPRDLGVAAMKKFSVENDPVTDVKQYLIMAGYDCSTRVYCPIDTVDEAEGDKRFLISTGPFDLAPRQSDSFVVALVASALWPDSLALASAAWTAESLYFNRVSGVAEEAGSCQRSISGATIAHGVLRWPGRSESVLLDIAGRKVMDLQPGLNDIRHVAPGVYFVRGPETEDGRPRTAVRKIMIQR
jgi:hypothetical protein